MKKIILTILALGFFTSCPPAVNTDHSENGGFVVLNSWGKGFWETVPDGKYTISYKALEKNPIVATVWSKDLSSPKVLLEITVDATERSNLYFEVSAGSGFNSTTGTTSDEVWKKRFLGGEEAYRVNFGTNSSFSGTQMYYDITELYSKLNTLSNKVFVWIKNKGTSVAQTLKITTLNLIKASDSTALGTLSPVLSGTGDSIANGSNKVYTFSSLPAVASGSWVSARSLLDYGNLITQVPNQDELVQLKNILGQQVPGKNYNQQFYGRFGTGLVPPTDSQYSQMARTPVMVKGTRVMASPALPTDLDWSSTQFFPPVGNQGVQGSCGPFNSAYYVQTFYLARLKNLDMSAVTWDDTNLKPQSGLNDCLSPSFIYNLVNGGLDNGSNLGDIAEVLTQLGAVSWQTMPYNGLGEGPTHTTTNLVKQWPTAIAFREAPAQSTKGYLPQSTFTAGYLMLNNSATVQFAKELLAEGYLLVIGVDANTYSQMNSQDQFSSKNMPSSWTVNHANTIVGYNDNLQF